MSRRSVSLNEESGQSAQSAGSQSLLASEPTNGSISFAADEEREEYERFMRTIFLDDLSDGEDEEDDDLDYEDYRPSKNSRLDDEEDDDDDDSDDEVAVNKGEVKDLLSGVFQAMAGEGVEDIPLYPNEFGASNDTNGDNHLTKNHVKGTKKESGPRSMGGATEIVRILKGSMDTHVSNLAYGGASHERNNESLASPNRTKDVSSAEQSSLRSPFSNEPTLRRSPTRSAKTRHGDAGSPGGVSALDTRSPSRGTLNNAASKGSIPSKITTAGPKRKSRSLISSVASQLFQGDNPGEILVDGLPIGSLKSLIARQISMAAQLLLQLILHAPEGSEVFQNAYNAFLELSNARQMALKQAALMAMNVENLQKFQKGGNSRKAGGQNFTISSDAGGTKGINTRGGHSAPLTRGRAADKGWMKLGRCLLDLPCFSEMESFFGLVDDARRAARDNIQHASLASAGSMGNPVDGDSTTADLAMHVRQGHTDSGHTTEYRNRSLTELTKQASHVLQILKMRMWTCLAPSSDFPLPASDVSKVDPNSLVGKHFFTPAEDDLLLRAVLTVGEHNWSQIRQDFLRSKSESSLQFRFNQNITSEQQRQSSSNLSNTGISTADGRSINSRASNEINCSDSTSIGARYMAYQRLTERYSERDQSWTYSEDMTLLDGFMRYGERWPLIQIYHLPHRSRQDIAQRWTYLQKLGSRRVNASSSVSNGVITTEGVKNENAIHGADTAAASIETSSKGPKSALMAATAAMKERERGQVELWLGQLREGAFGDLDELQTRAQEKAYATNDHNRVDAIRTNLPSEGTAENQTSAHLLQTFASASKVSLDVKSNLKIAHGSSMVGVQDNVRDTNMISMKDSLSSPGREKRKRANRYVHQPLPGITLRVSGQGFNSKAGGVLAGAPLLSGPPPSQGYGGDISSDGYLKAMSIIGQQPANAHVHTGRGDVSEIDPKSTTDSHTMPPPVGAPSGAGVQSNEVLIQMQAQQLAMKAEIDRMASQLAQQTATNTSNATRTKKKQRIAPTQVASADTTRGHATAAFASSITQITSPPNTNTTNSTQLASKDISGDAQIYPTTLTKGSGTGLQRKESILPNLLSGPSVGTTHNERDKQIARSISTGLPGTSEEVAGKGLQAMDFSIQLGGISTAGGPPPSQPGLDPDVDVSMTAASHMANLRQAEALLEGLSSSNHSNSDAATCVTETPTLATSHGLGQLDPTRARQARDTSTQLTRERSPSKPSGLFASVMAAAAQSQNQM